MKVGTSTKSAPSHARISAYRTPSGPIKHGRINAAAVLIINSAKPESIGSNVLPNP